jgi:hypothetical protein
MPLPSCTEMAKLGADVPNIAIASWLPVSMDLCVTIILDFSSVVAQHLINSLSSLMSVGISCFFFFANVVYYLNNLLSASLFNLSSSIDSQRPHTHLGANIQHHCSNDGHQSFPTPWKNFLLHHHFCVRFQSSHCQRLSRSRFQLPHPVAT